MQDINVYMQHYYAYMQDNHIHVHVDYVYMQDDYVNIITSFSFSAYSHAIENIM